MSVCTRGLHFKVADLINLDIGILVLRGACEKTLLKAVDHRNLFVSVSVCLKQQVGSMDDGVDNICGESDGNEPHYVTTADPLSSPRQQRLWLLVSTV